MIEYIEKLEHRNQYYLPLIDTFERGKVYCSFQIPLSFYIKNKDVLEEGKNYINLFKKIDIEEIWRENGLLGNGSYRVAGEILDEYSSIDEELYCVIQEYDRIDFGANSVENFIFVVLRILRLLEDIYPHNKEIYEKSLDKFTDVFQELKRLNSIIYNKNVAKYKKVFLPDSWFILPNQTLYNTGNGHKKSNLVYDFHYTINSAFEHSKCLNGVSSYYRNLAKKIKGNGFTKGDFKNFTNLIYSPVYTDVTHEFPTCHEPYTLNHIIGIVMATSYFYKFFEDMQNYCLNPCEEFNKLKELTNNELTDIFVRCCGFHKVESSLKKTITTSAVHYREVFKEYIDNGWNIDFISPIIIQRDCGKIRELDMESYFVKKYIK